MIYMYDIMVKRNIEILNMLNIDIPRVNKLILNAVLNIYLYIVLWVTHMTYCY